MSVSVTCKQNFLFQIVTLTNMTNLVLSGHAEEEVKMMILRGKSFEMWLKFSSLLTLAQYFKLFYAQKKTEKIMFFAYFRCQLTVSFIFVILLWSMLILSL